MSTATGSTDRLQSFDADESRADGSGGEPFGRSFGAISASRPCVKALIRGIRGNKTPAGRCFGHQRDSAGL